MLVALGDVERAESLSRDLLDVADGDPRTEHFAFHFLADCALIHGDVEEAAQRYRESLRAALPLGDVIETSIEVQGVAMAAAGTGRSHRALRLAGAVEVLWESLGLTFSVSFETRFSRGTSVAPARHWKQAPIPSGRRAVRWRSRARSTSP